ncbi:MAG: elongation factor G [Verrucomicrobia bacterium]|nr:elongation factor G [Verrucomicrobiota bacterium]
MKNIAISDVRNFAILGHSGAGKTTLLDSILFKMGINDRQGSPDNGSSMSDYTDEEREHKISIWATPFDGIYTSKSGKSVNLVMTDTPGYADFYGQVVSSCAVADASLIVIDASAGIQVGTNRAWRLAVARSMPRGIVVTGLDKDNVSFEGTLAAIQEVWGKCCRPATLPTADASAVASVLGANPPEELADRIAEIKGALIEYAAETDDTLLEKYLGGEDLSPEEISSGLHGAVHAGSLIPVFAVSGRTMLGVEEMLDAISLLFPSPEDTGIKDVEGNALAVDPDAPFCGHVWRAVNDPFVGQLSFVRVFSGTLKSDSEMFNATTDEKERVGQLLIVNGKKQEKVAAVTAGDVVAIPKLKNTSLNDSLCAMGHHIKVTPIEFPHPVTSYAVFPKSKGDEDKLATGISRVAEDDPTILVQRNEETSEMIIAGMGDVQLEVAVEKMKKRSNVEVELRTPKVAYRETITAAGEGHYKHKKQSGGRGQYGDVYLRVEPCSPDDEETFVNAIVGGAIPGNFIPAVQKGLVDGMEKGPLAGYKVINVKTTLYDGSYHDVDSSEIAFKIAGSRALHEAMEKARPVLLEPIMEIKVMIPGDFMGDVNGDLSHKRGRILGMGSENGMQVITAEAPQAELFKYSSELRSMTGGRGSFEIRFLRYETVPSNVAQKVIAAAQKEKEEE